MDIKRLAYIMMLVLSFPILISAQNQGETGRDTTVVKEKTLGEVVVSASNVTHEGRQDVVRVTNALKAGIHTTGEMLGKIQGIQYDPMSRAVTYMGSQNVLLLVDSVQKDQDFIKELKPGRFDRVYIIPHPTGQYDGYDAVISLHTIKTYEGFESMLLGRMNLAPGVNGRGDDIEGADGKLNLNYTRGNLNFTLLTTYVWLRQGRSRYYEKDYLLNGYRETTLENDRKDPASKSIDRRGKVSLSVDYRINSGSSVSVLWDFLPSSNSFRSDYRVRREHDGRTDIIDDHAFNRMSGKTLNNLALYYRLSKKGWMFNLTGTYNFSGWDQYYSRTMSSGYDYDDNRHNTMGYFWGGFSLGRKVNVPKGTFWLTLNDYLTTSRYRENRLETGTSLSKNTGTVNRLSLTAEYSLSRQFSGGADIGMVYRRSDNGTETTHQVSPMGRLWFTLAPSDRFFTRVNYRVDVINPTLGQQSDYGFYQDSLVWHVGNPALDNSVRHNLDVTLSFFRFLTLKGSYSHTSDAITPWICAGHAGDDISSPVLVKDSYVNSTSDSWQVSLDFYKSLSRSFDLSLYGYYGGYRASYGGRSHHKALPGGSGYLRYHTKANDFSVYLSTGITRYLTVSPQEIYHCMENKWGLSVDKYFLNKQLEITILYLFPLHLTSGWSKGLLESDALISRTWSNNQVHHDNWMQFTITYRLSKGRKVRKYNKQTFILQ